MQRTCRNPWCAQSFEVTEDDLAFLDRVSPVFAGKKELIPPPAICPDCRLQRRFAWRNERNLYRRSCALCGTSILSIHHADAAPPVFCLDCWWGDRWNALSFGLPLRPESDFLEQFRMLSDATPRPTLQVLNGQNSDFTNFSRDAKDCYLSFSIVHCERCLYSTHTDESRDCVDCEGGEGCELCYECSNCIDCYRLTHSVRCEHCSDSSFLYDCKNCNHCFLSANLRERQYVFRGEQLTPQEYERRLRKENLSSVAELGRVRRQFDTLLGSSIHHALITHCDHCTGDILKNCKNCRECFDCFSGEDSVRCYRSPPTFRDCGECYGVYGGSELCMEISNGKNVHRTLAAIQCQNSDECQYCLHCINARHLFGCIGVRNAEYCILNKQYTEEEYNRMVPSIIDGMRICGAWGNFFPPEHSPFAYNETVAQEYFPLTHEEVLQRGWKWREEADEVPKVAKVIPAAKLPDSIDDIPDDILNWAIECEATKRPYKIIKQELAFYRQMRLPIPRFHPDERHRRRMALRNPRKLWNRACAKCHQPIATSYSPERPEIVYCEECYLKEVY